jgi:TPR repeat protein
MRFMTVAVLVAFTALIARPAWVDAQANPFDTAEPQGRVITTDIGKIRADYDRAGTLYNEEKYAEALPLFVRLADQGHVQSAYVAGLMYHRGRGTQPDGNAAINYYRKAALAGHEAAACNLGLVLLNGESGAAKNEAQGVKWLKRSAYLGNHPGQVAFGAAIANGQAGERNLVEAAAWYMLAAERDNAQAKINLDQVRGMLSPADFQRAQQRAGALRDEVAQALEKRGPLATVQIGEPPEDDEQAE